MALFVLFAWFKTMPDHDLRIFKMRIHKKFRPKLHYFIKCCTLKFRGKILSNLSNLENTPGPTLGSFRDQYHIQFLMESDSTIFREIHVVRFVHPL